MLVDVKTLFSNSLLKIQNTPKVVAVQKMVTRDVLIPTDDGTGNEMVHPSKPDYNNPIHAIFDLNGADVFKFETKDGSVS